MAFTLSQSGMVVRWWRRREPGWRLGLPINALGAVTTAVIAVIVAATKFLSGAYLVIIAAPLLILLLLGIRRHYRSVSRQLRLEHIAPGKEVAAEPIVIVPIARLDRPARQAIAFANSISRHAVAVHVTNDPVTAEALRERWPEWAGTTELVVVESPYRALVGPLLAYMDALGKQAPNRPIVVVLNEVVPRHWWETCSTTRPPCASSCASSAAATRSSPTCPTTSTDESPPPGRDSLHCQPFGRPRCSGCGRSISRRTRSISMTDSTAPRILARVPIIFDVADGGTEHAPLVIGAVGGVVTRLVLDTGSEVHLLNRELVDENRPGH